VAVPLPVFHPQNTATIKHEKTFLSLIKIYCPDKCTWKEGKFTTFSVTASGYGLSGKSEKLRKTTTHVMQF